LFTALLLSLPLALHAQPTGENPGYVEYRENPGYTDYYPEKRTAVGSPKGYDAGYRYEGGGSFPYEYGYQGGGLSKDEQGYQGGGFWGEEWQLVPTRDGWGGSVTAANKPDGATGWYDTQEGYDPGYTDHGTGYYDLIYTTDGLGPTSLALALLFASIFWRDITLSIKTSWGAAVESYSSQLVSLDDERAADAGAAKLTWRITKLFALPPIAFLWVLAGSPELQRLWRPPGY
jgi:hypothetical protein